MQCPICDTVDQWEDINYILDRPGDQLVMCRVCAFATYLDVEVEDLRQAYEQSDFSKERKVAGTLDYITKLSKLPLNRAFLHDFLASRDNLRILDIGCSSGYLLKMFRDEFGHGSVCGTEWNPVHAKFGRHGYGLDIRKNIEDFGEGRFDFICLLQVLEHIKDPVVYLEKVLNQYLAEDGTLYISLPIWFDLLGLPSMLLPFPCGMEGVFVPGHINIFSLRNFFNLIHKLGLEVIQENYFYYGYRALLKKGDAGAHAGFDDFRERIILLENQKKALASYREGDFAGALGHYPKFPMAAVQNIFKNHSGNRTEKIEASMAAASLMPTVEQFPWITGNAWLSAGDLEKAQVFFEKAHALNPGAVEPLWQLAEICIIRKEFQDAALLYSMIMDMRPDLRFNPIEKGKPTCLDQLSACYLHFEDDFFPPSSG